MNRVQLTHVMNRVQLTHVMNRVQLTHVMNRLQLTHVMNRVQLTTYFRPLHVSREVQGPQNYLSLLRLRESIKTEEKYCYKFAKAFKLKGVKR